MKKNACGFAVNDGPQKSKHTRCIAWRYMVFGDHGSCTWQFTIHFPFVLTIFTPPPPHTIIKPKMEQYPWQQNHLNHTRTWFYEAKCARSSGWQRNRLNEWLTVTKQHRTLETEDGTERCERNVKTYFRCGNVYGIHTNSERKRKKKLPKRIFYKYDICF